MRLSPQICVLTALAFFLGYFLSLHLETPPQARIEGTAWCYVAEYPTYASYKATAPLSHSLIDVNGKAVRVYVRCN